jgi:hypothetical protein
MYLPAPLNCAPASNLAVERPLAQMIGATPSRLAVQPKECKTVTVEMAPPSPPAPSLLTEARPATAALAPVTSPADTVDAMLWEVPAPIRPKQLSEIISKPALEELLERAEPFTGLVMSIGVNESDSGMWHSQGLMQSIGNYIAGLATEQDFACCIAYDEFVLVCRGEPGALSQRRLNQIAERLWDYQLRGIGAGSILFSWGGVQVENQPLAEAVASATDRMRETQRIGHTAQSVRARLKAV